MTKALAIWITSNVGPTYQGGLAAYERFLIQALRQKTGLLPTVVCAMTHLDLLPPAPANCELPLIEFEKNWIGHISTPLWSRLAANSRHRLCRCLVLWQAGRVRNCAGLPRIDHRRQDRTLGKS